MITSAILALAILLEPALSFRHGTAPLAAHWLSTRSNVCKQNLHGLGNSVSLAGRLLSRNAVTGLRCSTDADGADDDAITVAMVGATGGVGRLTAAVVGKPWTPFWPPSLFRHDL